MISENYFALSENTSFSFVFYLFVYHNVYILFVFSLLYDKRCLCTSLNRTVVLTRFISFIFNNKRYFELMCVSKYELRNGAVFT